MLDVSKWISNRTPLIKGHNRILKETRKPFLPSVNKLTHKHNSLKEDSSKTMLPNGKLLLQKGLEIFNPLYYYSIKAN